MAVSKRNTRNIWVDPDDAPELTQEFFERADLYKGDKLIRRGRPKSEAPKVAVSLRIPPDVLARWKATGAGWQTRMVESLRRHAPETT
ncbi:BrnA antitoxin family protein [Pusillimonas noertemannii]|uniref:BrnA antitoxin family protein n=1 Tax=Pusillimonas noertemannii TaxID=305977 RepID=UPI000474CA1A|nr:BrnA antitoxin family protein [Pusillimonas noertemannii]